MNSRLKCSIGGFRIEVERKPVHLVPHQPADRCFQRCWQQQESSCGRTLSTRAKPHTRASGSPQRPRAPLPLPAWAILQLLRPGGRPHAAVRPARRSSTTHGPGFWALGRAVGVHNGESRQHRHTATTRGPQSGTAAGSSRERGRSSRSLITPCAPRVRWPPLAPAGASPSPLGDVCADNRLSFPSP